MSILKKFSKRTSILAVLGLLVLAGSALAYYEATSSGSGSVPPVAVAASPGNQTITLAALESQSQPALAPGAVDKYSIVGSWTGGATNVFVNTITPTISVDATHAAAGCLASWFTMPAITVNADETSGFSVMDNLTFTNLTGTNQNACSGATLSISLSSD